MKKLKDILGKYLKGKKVHIKCNCILNLDFEGVVIDYKIRSNEIIWSISSNGKIIEIGENHPDLMIEFI